MKISALISRVTKLEGKKSSVSIGNVREVLKCLKKVCEDSDAADCLIDYLWMPKTIKPKRK